MDALYTTIARTLIDASPPGTTKAWLTAEVEGDTSSAQYWYDVDGQMGQPEIGSADAFAISDALIDIRATMLEDGHAAWTTCTFSVFPDGRVKLDIAYDTPAA